jgi:hypothetical protein
MRPGPCSSQLATMAAKTMPSQRPASLMPSSPPAWIWLIALPASQGTASLKSWDASSSRKA